VIVVDDHPLVLEYVAAVLQKDFTVVALVRDTESLLAGWKNARADVIVLDVSLTVGTGFEAARRLRAAGCPAPIVFLSVHEEPEFVRAAWDAGATGYVAKRDLDCALAPALHDALLGRRYVSPAIASPSAGSGSL
jgi:DNA-binding NarL/FixJ family response regulator